MLYFFRFYLYVMKITKNQRFKQIMKRYTRFLGTGKERLCTKNYYKSMNICNIKLNIKYHMNIISYLFSFILSCNLQLSHNSQYYFQKIYI